MGEGFNLGSFSVNLAKGIENLSVKNLNINTGISIGENSPGIEDDSKEIGTKTSNKSISVNLNFVDSSSSKSFLSVGFSFPSFERTAELLNLNFSSKTESDNTEYSFVLNLASFVYSAINDQSSSNNSENSQILDLPKKTFTKMAHENAKKSDFSEEEIALLWEKFKIKVQEGDDGKLEYLFYKSPDSTPVKLSQQDIVNMLGHIENIKNNDELFNKALEKGNDLNLLNQNNQEIKQSPINENKDSDDGYLDNIKNNFKKNDENNINTSSDENGINKSYKNTDSVSENNYINAQAEKRKAEEKHHFKILSDLDKNRSETNHKKFKTWTDSLVNNIKEEAKDINDKKK